MCGCDTLYLFIDLDIIKAILKKCIAVIASFESVKKILKNLKKVIDKSCNII